MATAAPVTAGNRATTPPKRAQGEGEGEGEGEARSPMPLLIIAAPATKGNIAAAVCEASACVASGLVASTSVAGAPRGLLAEDMGQALLYFIMAQIALVVYSRLFDILFVTGNVWEKVSKGNVAVALTHGLQEIAFAMLVANALYKSSELLNFVAAFFVGGGVQLLMRVVLGNLILTGPSK